MYSKEEIRKSVDASAKRDISRILDKREVGKSSKSKAIEKKKDCKSCGVCTSCKAQKRKDSRNYNN